METRRWFWEQRGFCEAGNQILLLFGQIAHLARTLRICTFQCPACCLEVKYTFGRACDRPSTCNFFGVFPRPETSCSVGTQMSVSCRLWMLPPAAFRMWCGKCRRGLELPLLTDFIEQSPSWEADSFWASQIYRNLWNQKVHYRSRSARHCKYEISVLIR